MTFTRARRKLSRSLSQPPALRVPFLARTLHFRSAPASVRRLVRALTGVDPAQYLAELDASGLPARIAAADAEFRALEPTLSTGTVHPAEGAVLYALLRVLQPQRVVETGVANGSTSSYLLQALDRNGAGTLHSIDLPFTHAAGTVAPVVPGPELALWATTPIPAGRTPGWMVPDDVRGRWDLRLGDSRELLPALMDELEQIDIFLHDSRHSREHMLFEFECVWPHLQPSGILISDDVFTERHDALPAFASSVGMPWRTFGNLGFVPAGVSPARARTAG